MSKTQVLCLMVARLPPLNPLRTFEAVARLGSMKRAAEELHVTQGAVSHQIRALEEALGRELIRRLGRRIELTSAGAALLPVTSTAFDSIRAIVDRIGGVPATGELRISCAPGLLSGWLLPNIAAFLRLHPAVELTIIASNTIGEDFAPQPEVMIRYGTGRWVNHWVSFLGPVVLSPICSPELLADIPISDVNDLANHQLLHSGSLLEWNNWLAVHAPLGLGHKGDHILLDAYLSMQAAAAGLGVALGDQINTRSLLAEGKLVKPLPLSLRAVHDYYLACRSVDVARPQVRAFVDWIYGALQTNLSLNTQVSPSLPFGATDWPDRQAPRS